MPNQVRILTSIKDEVSGPLGRIIDKFERFQKQGAKGFAIGVGAFAAAKGFSVLDTAASAAIGVIGDSIQKASDLNETLSKSSVIFGDSAKDVEAWGGTLAKNFGISKRAGIEAAASFGNVFKNLGQSSQAAADMSKTMVELAGDLASLNNLDTDVALEKLRSGLAGEAEPLRAVGVFLTEAKVKAKAMAMGLADSNGELSEGAKVMARYKLILEQTTTAHGDAARTIGEFAGQQRVANAQLEDAEARFGQLALPLYVQGLTTVNIALGLLSDTAGDATDNFKTLSDGIDSSVIPVFAKMPGPFGDAARALLGINQAGRDLLGIVPIAAKGFDDVHEAAVKLGPAASTAAGGVDDLGGEMKDAAKKAKELEDKVKDLADELIHHLYGKAVAAGDRAELQQQMNDYAEQITAAKHHLRELEAIDHPTKKQREDIADTSRNLIILRGDLAKTRGEYLLLEHDQAKAKGAKALKAWYDRVGRSLKAGDKEGEDFLAQMRAIDNFSDKLPKNAPVFFGAIWGKTFHGKAIGGPVKAGEPYVVGEKGPELFMPGQSGTIVPNHDLKSGKHPAVASSSGGGFSLNVTVNAAPGMSPAGARELGDVVGPAIYDYLYRRGAVGRAA